MSARAVVLSPKVAASDRDRRRPVVPRPVVHRATTYGRQVPLVLLFAFLLSAVHTVYSSVSGIADPGFGVDDPAAWAFYLVAFGMTALATREAAWAQNLVLGYLGVLLAVGVFVYPSMFGPEQQTVFGWFENDVYMGLLMIGAYLSVLRRRAVTIGPGA